MARLAKAKQGNSIATPSTTRLNHKRNELVTTWKLAILAMLVGLAYSSSRTSKTGSTDRNTRADTSSDADIRDNVTTMSRTTPEGESRPGVRGEVA